MCLNEICKQLLVSYTHGSTYTYEYLIKEFYEKINVVNDVYILENIILNDENWGFTIEVYMVLFSKLKLLNFDSEQAELKYYSFLSMYMDNSVGHDCANLKLDSLLSGEPVYLDAELNFNMKNFYNRYCLNYNRFDYVSKILDREVDYDDRLSLFVVFFSMEICYDFKLFL